MKSNTTNELGIKSESEQSQTYALEKENNLNSTQKIEQVEGTPFCIVHTMEENECFIACGGYRVSEVMTEAECKNKIDSRDWLLICAMFDVIKLSTQKN